MHPITNFSDVKSSTQRAPLPAGGYVVKITNAEELEAKEYFKITWDIAEGDEKDRFADDWGKEHPWAHQFVASYKETALGLFKSFTEALDASNGSNLTEKAEKEGLNASDLIGKKLGVLIGYEEYLADSGDVKQSAKVRSYKGADVIRNGDFKIPELKKLKTEAPVSGFSPITDENLPF